MIVTAAYWTTAELADHRNCSAKSLKTLREKHGLPFDPQPKGFRYPIEEVLAWEAARVQTSEPTLRKLRQRSRPATATLGPNRRLASATRVIRPRPVALGV